MPDNFNEDMMSQEMLTELALAQHLESLFWRGIAEARKQQGQQKEQTQ